MKKHEHIIAVCIMVAAIVLGAGASYFTFSRASGSAEYDLGYMPYNLFAADFAPDFFMGKMEMAYAPSIKSQKAQQHLVAQHRADEILHKYVLTSQDGFIVVLYAGHNKSGHIHSITNTPVSSLPEDEQERLAAGINIYTEDALFRILEDFGS